MTLEMQFIFFYICRMSKKWYFGILITAFTMLFVMRQQTVVPNQEIVLEFINIEPTSNEAQSVITIVKEQLESIGVQHTRILKDQKNGKLKITYYSDADVESIKKILSEKQNIALDHIVYDQNEDGGQSPLDKNSKDYNFDVYEIQKSTDFGSDLNGKFVLETKQKREVDSSTNVYNFVKNSSTDQINKYLKRVKKINVNTALIPSNTIYNIPEVRAGPIS